MSGIKSRTFRSVPPTCRSARRIDLTARLFRCYPGPSVNCVLHRHQVGHALVALNAENRPTKCWCDSAGVLNARHTYARTENLSAIVRKMKPRLVYTNDASLLADLLPGPAGARRRSAEESASEGCDVAPEPRAYVGADLLEVLDSLAARGNASGVGVDGSSGERLPRTFSAAGESGLDGAFTLSP